jgi:hypothetical protein
MTDKKIDELIEALDRNLEPVSKSEALALLVHLIAKCVDEHELEMIMRVKSWLAARGLREMDAIGFGIAIAGCAIGFGLYYIGRAIFAIGIGVLTHLDNMRKLSQRE